METVTLDDPEALDASRAGSKAAELARLRVAGFNVPDGVVLPVGIAGRWWSNRQSSGTNGRHADRTDEPPGDVRDVLVDISARLGNRLAVRSSATWEDGATSSHAGATATELDVSGADALAESIGRCLSMTAAAQQAVGTNGDVAILLQHMVPAEWAGVAFTADPLSGERGVVRIAATRGLGEALVQGEVVGIDVTVRGEAPDSPELDGDPGGMPLEDLFAVAEIARSIEALHGRPQDIEWAVAGGEVYLLQARPITVLPTEPDMPTGNNWQKDLAHYPEPVTPFGWSALQLSADEVRAVFDERGLLVRGLEERFVGGEIYSRVLPAFGSPDSASKPPPALVLGIASRIVPELRRRNATARAAIQTGQAQRWVEQWHAVDRDDMTHRFEELARVELRSLDDAGLIEHLDACIALTRRGIRIHFRLVMPLAMSLYRLHRLVGGELGWDDSRIAGMLAGHSPATRAAEESLSALRKEVKSIPGAVEGLEADPADPTGVLAELDETLADRLREWTSVHGWAMVNYDAGVPVLAERPTTITRLLLSDPTPTDFAAGDAAAQEARGALPAHLRDDFDEALGDARAIYPVREDNTIVVGDRPLALLRQWMLEVADRLVERGLLGVRSDAAYLQVDELSDALTASRRAGARVGVGGSGAGDLSDIVVQRRSEEAWMRAHPGPNYIGEQAPQPDISRLPRALRQVNEAVLWVIGHEYPAPVETPAEDAVLVAGVAASAGVAEGPVRVISSHHDMDRLREGDVLVCQVTSPSWAPVFPLAAAVVADGGGVLSHAAIAARENGLPAVLGTGSATQDLLDGQRVRVDGTRGLVLAAD